MTAAVVGVIGSLGWSFGRVVLWPEGVQGVSWPAVVIAAIAFILLLRARTGLLWILAGGTAAGTVMA